MPQSQLTHVARLQKQVLVKSISYNEATILRGIMRLYCPQGFHLDPTYGKGHIHRGLPGPRLKYDINPRDPYAEKADCRALPFTHGEIESIVFDPPFLGGGSDKGVMIGKFSNFSSVPELWKFYGESLKEFYRILAPGSFLVFKCQDMVENHKQYFSHVEIINMARAIGFYPRDLFILLSRNRILRANQKTQQHARKYHCYWLVFEKLMGQKRFVKSKSALPGPNGKSEGF